MKDGFTGLVASVGAGKTWDLDRCALAWFSHSWLLLLLQGLMVAVIVSEEVASLSWPFVLPWGHAGRFAVELEDNTGGQILRLRLRDRGPLC